MSTFSEIGNYFFYLQKKYNLQICIKDYCGFIPINHALDETLRPFLAHTNPFCMYIKSDIQQYRACQLMIRKMHDKCQGCGEFYGQCHAGLGEYVIPIAIDGDLLGTLNLGFFQLDEERTMRRIGRVCGESSILKEETALQLYRESISSTTIDIEDVLPACRLVAEYLAFTYKIIKDTHQTDGASKRFFNSSEDTILAHAMDYIHLHYNQRISVDQLAEYCHCSTTYLSRVFKKRTGINLNLYINKVRIEIAKHDLMVSGVPITDIALNIGFNDPNYFCRVFNQLTGITPTEFRRRFHKASPDKSLQMMDLPSFPNK